MSTTLTIRNLDEAVKQKLRVRAAQHGRSMEAEARAILTREVDTASVEAHTAHLPAKKGKFDHLIGIWAERGTTDEMMRELRGED